MMQVESGYVQFWDRGVLRQKMWRCDGQFAAGKVCRV